MTRTDFLQWLFIVVLTMAVVEDYVDKHWKSR